MAYYCRKCRRWHETGAIARSHKIFSARPPRSGFRPKAAKPRLKVRQTRRRPKRILKKLPSLVITHKKKIPKVKTPARPAKLRKAKIGLSRMRRGQLQMRPGDLYENQMVKRLRRTTGMTHIQVMNLVNLAKKSDYIDIETEISEAAGLSNDKTETYEFAKKNILKKLERSGDVTIENKYSDPSYYEKMYHNWQMQQAWNKAKKKVNLI